MGNRTGAKRQQTLSTLHLMSALGQKQTLISSSRMSACVESVQLTNEADAVLIPRRRQSPPLSRYCTKWRQRAVNRRCIASRKARRQARRRQARPWHRRGRAASARHGATPTAGLREAAATAAGSRSDKRVNCRQPDFACHWLAGTTSNSEMTATVSRAGAAASTTFCKPVLRARLSQPENKRNGCRGEQQSFHDFQIEA